ncbi:hypothetical protein EGW08_014083 [Elysia chlorotica]|uniref:Protein quiver n=1 Tax=Elysia chlorotica TaxID=188477 RepID=A0A3S1BYE4_ELYCH|nr:hypothetical protein EGW08_014083 [Elysia chlorotica]
MASVAMMWLVGLSSLLLLLLHAPVSSAIGCFVCTSINRRNPDCEDTFNNTGKFYVEDCWASRRGRTGSFPGTQCIKMIAEDPSINYTVVVRNCVVDDGGTNSETEIGRESHCGWMRVLKYEGRRMRGCILSCDTDACNLGSKHQGALTATFSAAVAVYLLVTNVLFRSTAG